MKGRQPIKLLLTVMAVLISANLAFAAHYEYDALGRLVKVDYTNEQTTKSAFYSYDAGGNIEGVTGFQSVTEITTVGTTETVTETATETTTSNTAALVWNYSTDERLKFQQNLRHRERKAKYENHKKYNWNIYSYTYYCVFIFRNNQFDKVEGIF